MSDADPKTVLVFPRGRRHAWVAEGLRRDIMLGEIEPGATVTELEVAARFHCSQSTVREALLLLQEEGLVQRSPHRGTRVASDIACDHVQPGLGRRRVLSNANKPGSGAEHVRGREIARHGV